MGKRILCLNDLGFQYGAGIASARQISSLLLGGNTVAALAWEPGDIPESIVFSRPGLAERWLGMHRVSHLAAIHGLTDDEIIEGVLCEAARFRPEVIIIGNLHSPKWPLRLIDALHRLGAEVITYVHDCYLFTGRCAYPGDCRLFLSGCDQSCPTPNEYPPLPPDLIAPSWQLRRQLFGKSSKTQVVTNSHWSRDSFKSAIPDTVSCRTVYLGADESIFKPGDRHAAREALSLPSDKPLILAGAVNFDDRRKGGHHLEELIQLMGKKVNFAGFGHNPQMVEGMIQIPFQNDPSHIARIYQAADLFVATSLEESFGQTILEAQLCGIPVVAFNVGGIPEIVHNEITGKLVPKNNIPELATAIRALVGDTDLLRSMGVWSRCCAQEQFSLYAQAEAWNQYLQGDHPHGAGASSPELIHDCKTNNGTYRPSWAGVTEFVNDEHKVIFEQTSRLPGWQMPGDTLKLYEMAYFAGDTILEIGTYGGRSATVELRGALANPNRTQPPQFYGVDIDAGSIARTRQTLVNGDLDQYCHLYHGVLSEFLERWNIIPTMIFVDGDHRYDGVIADIKLLSKFARSGTPILFHDFLNPENQTGGYGVRRGVEEWVKSGHVRLVSYSGCSALVVVN